MRLTTINARGVVITKIYTFVPVNIKQYMLLKNLKKLFLKH